MTQLQAIRYGGKLGIFCSGFGIVIAQLIMSTFFTSEMGFLRGFFWFTTVNYKLNLFTGAIILLLSGYFFGRIAAKMIIINHYNYIIVGFLTGMTVLLNTALLSGVLGFFQEGLDNIGSEDDPFEDYIFKPFYWVSLFGIIPSLIVGALFGYRLEKARHRIN